MYPTGFTGWSGTEVSRSLIIILQLANSVHVIVWTWRARDGSIDTAELTAIIRNFFLELLQMGGNSEALLISAKHVLIVFSTRNARNACETELDDKQRNLHGLSIIP